MSNKNTDLKSRDYIKQHNLEDKVTIDDKGIFGDLTETFNEVVLLDAGVTLDQLKKVQKNSDEFLSAVTLIGGEKSVQAFTANNELTETCLSYKIGGHQQASVLFNREGKDHVVAAVETKVKSAEFKRVTSHLNELFDNINS